MKTIGYNNARLRSSLSLQQPTGNWTNGFTYDAARRLSTVTSGAGTYSLCQHLETGSLDKLRAHLNASLADWIAQDPRPAGVLLDRESSHWKPRFCGAEGAAGQVAA